MPAAAGQIITHAGSLTTLAIIGLLPGSTDILAGMSLGGRVQGMLMFPLTAVNMSVVMLSGHLLGSGAGDGLYQLRTQNRAAYGASAPSPPALLLYLLREPAASCFSADPPVLQQASTFLVFACLSLPFTAMTGMMNAFFSGAGATILSCRIGAVTCWVVDIPLSLMLGPGIHFGAAGVYAAGTMGQIAAFLCMLRIFREKKWLEYGLRKRHTA